MPHCMKSLTLCQRNRTKVGVKMVIKHPAVYGIKSPTFCQDKMTRVGVKTVRRQPAGPDMKSLTSCQCNRKWG